VVGEVDLRMGSFGKALASAGGFIAGSGELIDFLRFTSRAFLFTTSAVPAALAAALESVRICRSEEGLELSERLLANARRLHDGLADRGFGVVPPSRLGDGTEAVTPVVPVLVGDDHLAMRAWRALFDAGLFCNVALHPAVRPGGALLRLSARAVHDPEHVARALDRLEMVGQQLGLISDTGAPGQLAHAAVREGQGLCVA
jgi:8-amino-7-oxononanoate synthase